MKKKKVKPIKWADLFENMSMNILSDELPSDWQDMDEDDLYAALEEAAWNPIEGMAGSEIYDNILNAADNLTQLLLDHGVEIDFGSKKHPNRSHIGEFK